MRKTFVTPSEAIGRLKNRMGGKSQAEFAREIGVTQQELNDTLREARYMPEKILMLLGLENAGRMYQLRSK